jgi:hypothetical protein
MQKRVLLPLLILAAFVLSACGPVELESSGTPTKTPVIIITLRPTDFVIRTADSSDQSTPATTLYVLPELRDGRFYEEFGLVTFSYVPPVDWMGIPATATALTSWLGPQQSGGMRCLIGFSVSESTKTANEAAAEALSQMPGGQADVKILSEGEFTTQAGGDAYKIIMQAATENADLIFGVYMFSKDGYLISTFYFRLAAENPEQDAVIERSMKTVRFE